MSWPADKAPTRWAEPRQRLLQPGTPAGPDSAPAPDVNESPLSDAVPAENNGKGASFKLI